MSNQEGDDYFQQSEVIDDEQVQLIPKQNKSTIDLGSLVSKPSILLEDYKQLNYFVNQEDFEQMKNQIGFFMNQSIRKSVPQNFGEVKDYPSSFRSVIRLDRNNQAPNQVQTLPKSQQILKTIFFQVSESHQEHVQDLKKLIMTEEQLFFNKEIRINYIKFFLRLFARNAHSFTNKLTEKQKQAFNLVGNRIKKMKYRTKAMNKKLINELLGEQPLQKNPQSKRIARKLFRIILSKVLTEQIFNNNHLHSKKQNMILSKIISLRCMSAGTLKNMRLYKKMK